MRPEISHRNLAVLRLVLLCCAAFPFSLAASPRVTVGQTSFDFGNVAQGQPVTADFSLENSGSEPLVVEKIEFSMPGMSARVKQRLEPGETARVEVTWDTSTLRREVDGQMTLHVNDPSTPELTLRLTGTVIPALEFTPRPAFYFSQFAGESQTKSITLKNNRDDPLVITGLSSSAGNFEYGYEEIEPGRIFKLTVSTRPDTAPGRFRETLVVSNSNSRYSKLHVEVNILVKPDVFISSETADFGNLRLSSLKANPSALDFIQQTLVISRRKGVMRITSFDSDIPFLVTQLQPSEPSARFQIEVSLDSDSMKIGAFDGHLNLHTDDPEFPLLQIPVSGHILE